MAEDEEYRQAIPEGKKDDIPLSKNALKRQLKRQRWEESKADRRAVKRAKLKERKEKQKVSGDYVPQTNRVAVQGQQASGVRVVVDCAFDDLMTDKVSSPIPRKNFWILTHLRKSQASLRSSLDVIRRTGEARRPSNYFSQV